MYAGTSSGATRCRRSAPPRTAPLPTYPDVAPDRCSAGVVLSRITPSTTFATASCANANRTSCAASTVFGNSTATTFDCLPLFTVRPSPPSGRDRNTSPDACCVLFRKRVSFGYQLLFHCCTACANAAPLVCCSLVQ